MPTTVHNNTKKKVRALVSLDCCFSCVRLLPDIDPHTGWASVPLAAYQGVENDVNSPARRVWVTLQLVVVM